MWCGVALNAWIILWWTSTSTQLCNVLYNPKCYVVYYWVTFTKQKKSATEIKITTTTTHAFLLRFRTGIFKGPGSGIQGLGSPVSCFWSVIYTQYPIYDRFYTIFILFFVLLSLFLPFHLSRNEIFTVYEVYWTIYSFLSSWFVSRLLDSFWFIPSLTRNKYVHWTYCTVLFCILYRTVKT